LDFVFWVWHELKPEGKVRTPVENRSKFEEGAFWKEQCCKGNVRLLFSESPAGQVYDAEE